MTFSEKEDGRARGASGKMMKRILSFFLTVALSAALLAPAASAANEAAASKDTDWLYITIDPGHGGDGAGGYDPGAINSTYGYQ